MTFAEFESAVAAIAGEHYYSCSVEISRHGKYSRDERPPREFEWWGYVDGMSWNGSSRVTRETPELVLAVMRGEPTGDIEQIDPLPEATPCNSTPASTTAP
jgi:hypothetical protein